LFHVDSLGSCALQVTLSARHAARSTWVSPPLVQVRVPVFEKKTWNWSVWPGLIVTKADSPEYAESYPVTANAGVGAYARQSATSARIRTYRIFPPNVLRRRHISDPNR